MPNTNISINDATRTPRANKLIIDNPDIGEKLAALAANADALQASGNGAYEGVMSTKAARDDAIRISSRYRDSAEQSGHPVDPNQAALDDAAVAQAEKAYERAQRNSKTVVSRSADADHVHRKVTTYLNELGIARTTSEPHPGPIFALGRSNVDTDFTFVEPKPFKGDIDEALAKNAAAIKAHERAPLTAEEVEMQLIGQLDALAEQATIGVSFGKHPSLNWPVELVRAAESTSPGLVPTASDLRPWIARHFRNEIVADIKQRVAEKYASVELALNEKDKRKQLAKLKAERLELDRVRCTRIWEGYETNQTATLDFPADADPRAVLGIEGPEPTPLKL